MMMFTRVAEKIVLANSRTRVVIGVVVCCNGSVWLVILVVISFTSLPWLVELCFVVHDALATSLRTPVGPALLLHLGNSPSTSRCRRSRGGTAMIAATAVG